MSLQTRLASFINEVGADYKIINTRLNKTPLIIERNEAGGNWPLRNTVTSDTNVVVIWIGSVPAPTSTGYAIRGRDLRILRS